MLRSLTSSQRLRLHPPLLLRLHPHLRLRLRDPRLLLLELRLLRQLLLLPHLLPHLPWTWRGYQLCS